MSEEKKLEEMTEIIKSTLDDLGSGNFSFTGDEISTMFAKALYNAGYRKQSEGIANNATTTGKWVWKSNGYMKCLHCSCCGRQEEWETTYCPNCGAKMKGAANEQK